MPAAWVFEGPRVIGLTGGRHSIMNDSPQSFASHDASSSIASVIACRTANGLHQSVQRSIPLSEFAVGEDDRRGAADTEFLGQGIALLQSWLTHLASSPTDADCPLKA